MLVNPETAIYELGIFLCAILLGTVFGAIIFGILTLPVFYVVLFGTQLGLRLAQATGFRVFNFLSMMFRSITRNLLRTSLSYFAIFMLVFVISGVWSILNFMDKVTEENSNNLKAIITEKHQIPSQMPRRFEKEIIDIAMNLPPDMRPKNAMDDVMTWSFVGGSLDPNNRTWENTIFLFAMEPRKLLTMMDGIDELSASELAALTKAIDEMEHNPKAIVVGAEKLELMKKRVGDRIKITSFNYVGLEFDCDIVAEFPKGSRYAQSAVMNRDYLYRAVDSREQGGSGTLYSDKCLNLIWIRLPSKQAFEMMASEVNKTGKFTPAVKMETASSAIGTWLEPYRDIFWGMRYILSPMLIIIITLIIAIAVSIGVRERRTEMAVLKVLGFRPRQVLGLVLGEAMLVGLISGAISSLLVYVLVMYVMSGLKIPIAFFPKFMLPLSVLLWGPMIGTFASFIGSIVPAWTTHRIKAAEVFARVT